VRRYPLVPCCPSSVVVRLHSRISPNFTKVIELSSSNSSAAIVAFLINLFISFDLFLSAISSYTNPKLSSLVVVLLINHGAWMGFWTHTEKADYLER